MKRTICVLFSLIFISSQISFAEDSETSPNTTHLTRAQKNENNIYELMLNVLKTSDGIKEDVNSAGVSNEDKITVVYEKLVELHCMPNLYLSLQYGGNPKDKTCLSYISELERRYPESPVLQCAKFGIDSSACKTAYEKVYFGTFDSSEVTPDEVSLSAKVNMEMAGQKHAKLNNLLAQKRNELRSTDKSDKEEIKKLQSEIQNLYSQLLDLECKTDIIRLVHKKPDEYKTFKSLSSEQKTKKVNKSLSSLVENFNKTFAENDNDTNDAENNSKSLAAKFNDEQSSKKAPLSTWRIRLINQECNELIENVTSHYPNMPAAVCAKYGKLTPQCINSWRVLKAKLIKERQGIHKTPANNQLFKTF